jgi:hypothetical protein
MKLNMQIGLRVSIEPQIYLHHSDDGRKIKYISRPLHKIKLIKLYITG